MTIASFLFSVEPEPEKVKTEVDTFDALRRIPREKLENELFEECRAISRNERQHVIEDEINSKDPIGLHTCMDVSILDVLYGRQFVGTGWTVKDYASICYEEEKQERRQLLKKKRLCTLYLILCCTIAGSLSMTLTPLMPGYWFVVSSVLSGMIMGRVFIAIRDRIMRESL